MKKGNNKKIVWSLLLLLIVGSFITLFVFKNHQELEDTGQILNEEMYAVLVEKNVGTGNYEEINSESWPSSSYLYNSERSSCVDENGNTINGILKYSNQNHIVSVLTAKTVRCYLYFDLVGDKPVISTIKFQSVTSDNNYTNSLNQTLTASWNDSDIDKYCITTKPVVAACDSSVADGAKVTWTSISGKSLSKGITLNNQDGEQTYYLFIRDKDQNVSEPYSASIILDRKAPEIRSINYQIVRIYDEQGGLSQVFYNGSDISGTISFNPTDRRIATAGTGENPVLCEKYNISVYAIDKAGNKSTTETVNNYCVDQKATNPEYPCGMDYPIKQACS